MRKLFSLLAIATMALVVFTGCKKDIVPSVTPADGLVTTYDVPATGSTIDNVKFTSTAAWQATPTQSWVTVKPSSGEKGDNNVSISVAENTSNDPRTAKVTITCGDETIEISINQKAADSIELADGMEEVLEIGYEGGELDVVFSSNNNWTFSCDKDWVTAQPSSGDASAAGAVLTVAANNGDAREAVATFTNGKSSVSVTVKQGSAPADISALGTANCYMVSDAGTYRFKPTKGNSAEAISGIASVESLWEYSIFGGANAVVAAEGLEYKDGFIWFKATGTEGSVGIAAKDASGNILWSWHIWVLKSNPDITIGSTTLQTYNLGYIPWPSNDAYSWGLLYQWGRKDPFGIKWATVVTPADAFTTAATVADSGVIGADGTALDYSIAHPNVFIGGNDTSCDWFAADQAKQNSALWGETKTMYDPCPVGYKVAPSSFFKSLDGSKIVADLSDIRHSMVYDGKLDFFYAGYIHYNKTWAAWEYSGSWTWSSTVPQGSPFAYSCFILGGNMEPEKGWYRGNAMMVRCVKE